MRRFNLAAFDEPRPGGEADDISVSPLGVLPCAVVPSSCSPPPLSQRRPSPHRRPRPRPGAAIPPVTITVAEMATIHASADIPSQREGGATPAGESPAGDLIADAQRVETGTQLAFVNTGSIRAGLLAGPVTFGNLFTMQPFQDDFVDTFTLTGSQVWALLGQQLAGWDGRHHAGLGAALHPHRTQRQRVDHRRLARPRGRRLAPDRRRRLHVVHRYGELVHGRWRRRLHDPRVSSRHRADRRRRAGPAR